VLDYTGLIEEASKKAAAGFIDPSSPWRQIMKPLDKFYEECIRSKIARCESKASRINGRSQCIRHHAELMRVQATFLEDEKERLVQEMIKNKESLKMDLAGINDFLNASFLTSSIAKAPGNGHGVASERAQDYLGCYPWDEASKRKMREPVIPEKKCYTHPECLSNLFEPPWSDGSIISDEDDERP
jgi:hypothetical protein